VVQTVRGPISPAQLGTVEIRGNYPDYWDEDTRVADAVAKLTALKRLGVDTITDPTVIGLGRDIGRIQRVNARVDINIIPATDLCTYNDLQYAGPNTLVGGEDPMIEMFIADHRAHQPAHPRRRAAGAARAGRRPTSRSPRCSSTTRAASSPTSANCR
jgi:phosphotriesterase-related protein